MTITTTCQQTVRAPATAIRARCSACKREVETLTTTQAAMALEVSERTLTGLVAEGRVHAIPTVSGSVRVCKDSLFVNEPSSVEGTKEVIKRQLEAP